MSLYFRVKYRSDILSANAMLTNFRFPPWTTRRKLKLNLVICPMCVAVVTCSALNYWAQRKNQPTEQQQVSLREFIQKYVENPGDPSYEAAFVDLRDDGVQQAIVYLTDRSSCGSGGCVTLILEPTESSYKVVTEVTITRPPIRVLKSKSNGWHDISVVVAGGGILHGYEAKLSFDGTSYPSNPTSPPAQPVEQQIEGGIVIPVSVIGKPHEETPKRVDNTEVVIPGQAVGSLRLGMTGSDASGPVFQWQPKPLVGWPRPPCSFKKMTWLDDDNRSPGVTAYLSNDVVYQVVAKSHRFQVEGMRDVFGKGPEELRRLLPDGELLRWKGSAWRVPSQKDELFWVVRSRGIAFELDYGNERNSISRSVKSIVVFQPQAKFEPEGCLRSHETLVPAEPSDGP